MTRSLTFRAALVSVLIFVAFILAWHLATRGTGAVQAMDPEYAKLMGATATQGKSAMPGPLDVGVKLWEHIRRPFYDNGPNDKGLGIQLGYSIGRVGLGYLLAVIVAIPLGFLIGMSPLIWPQRLIWVMIQTANDCQGNGSKSIRSGTRFTLPSPSANVPVSTCSTTVTGWLR